MRGGAQGHLMRCSDGNFYVVKFRNNPQHLRVLANELLATRLAQGAELPVAAAEVVEVGDWLIEHTPELNIQLASLDHEIRDDTMKDRTVVQPVFRFLSADRMSPLAFPFGKLGEIGDSFGRIFFEETADDCSF